LAEALNQENSANNQPIPKKGEFMLFDVGLIEAILDIQRAFETAVESICL
jgi:hypothetical protein